MRNRKIALSGLAAWVFVGSCQVPYCQEHETDPECQIAFDLIQDTYKKGVDSEIKVSATLKGAEPLSAQLDQGNINEKLTATLVNGNNYKLTIDNKFAQFRLGDLTLSLQQGFRRAAPVTARLIKPLSYSELAPFTSPTVAKNKQPVLQFMGIGKGIFGLVSGISVMADTRSVRRYTFGPSGLAESTTSEFFSSPVSPSALISVTPGSLFLSDNPDLTPATAYKCSTVNSPIMKSDCAQLGFSLPAGTKTMLVSPDDSRMILADDMGTLSWCNLATQQKPPCPNSIATTKAGVLLALSDLNNDKKQDLLAAWVDSGQLKVGVYLGSESGFANALDPPLSQQLSTALGSSAIDALAAADLDGDGFDGDVVFARGLKVTLLQSQLDRFESVWSADLDPAQAGPKINTLAVGRLDASSTADKPMDILASSNTPYDAMNQSTLYVHVFRPQ